MIQDENKYPIPIFRPAISDEEIGAVSDVLRSCWIGPGSRVRSFESAFAQAVGVPYAITTSSGTAALSAALYALDVRAGDEVIFPSFSFITLFQVIVGLGAVPVFADIEPEHLTLDPDDVARKITSRTKCIINVHHGGQLSDMDALLSLSRDSGVPVIDDAAHAAGASYKGEKVGCLGFITCFSFSAVKNLTTGDGGMITSSDEDIWQRLTAFRNLGMEKNTWDRYGRENDSLTNRWAYNVAGYGQRIHMNDISASIGLVQLKRLPELNRKRAELVRRYEEAFSGLDSIRSVKPRPNTRPSWHMYTVLLKNRDRFVEEMRNAGVTIGVHYYPVHLYPIAKPYHTSMPVTEEIWKQVTTFPLYPTMTGEDHQRVVNAACDAVDKCLAIH